MARNIPGGYPQIPYRAVTDGRLKATDIRVLCVIINHCYEGGVKARVSYRKLKDECHARLETIQSSIERLKETGWISLTSGGQFGGDNVANLYTVHFDNGYEDTEEDTPSEKQDTPRPDKQKTHKTLKPSKGPKEKPSNTALLRKLFTLNGAYLPEESDMAYMWKDTLEAFKAELESGKYTLTEDTFEQCKKHVYQLRHQFM